MIVKRRTQQLGLATRDPLGLKPQDEIRQGAVEP